MAASNKGGVLIAKIGESEEAPLLPRFTPTMPPSKAHTPLMLTDGLARKIALLMNVKTTTDDRIYFLIDDIREEAGVDLQRKEFKEFHDSQLSA